MKKSCTSGFTLIEVIISIGIIAIVATFTLSENIESYGRYSFRDERDTFVLSLQKVRSRSLNSVCVGLTCSSGVPHGIHVEMNTYTIFQGTAYDSTDPTNEVMNFSPAIHTSGATDITFEPLSGNATTLPAGQSDILLVHDSVHTSTIHIGSEGYISWTH